MFKQERGLTLQGKLKLEGWVYFWDKHESDPLNHCIVDPWNSGEITRQSYWQAHRKYKISVGWGSSWRKVNVWCYLKSQIKVFYFQSCVPFSLFLFLCILFTCSDFKLKKLNQVDNNIFIFCISCLLAQTSN